MHQYFQPKNVKAHWKEFRPKMYRELEKKGTLNQEIELAIDRTKDEMLEMIEKGTPYHQAWESVMERYILLPDEKEVPRLGESPY